MMRFDIDNETLKWKSQIKSVKKVNLNHNKIRSLKRVGKVFPSLEFLAVSNLSFT